MSVLSTQDLDLSYINEIIDLAIGLKSHREFSSLHECLKGKCLVLYFEKKSTRTRLSCISAWKTLGGHVIELQDSHIGVNESIYDSFRVIGEIADCIVARVLKHDTLLEIDKSLKDNKKRCVLINGLCDTSHPLQCLADIMTIQENKTKENKNIVVTWVGDGNNVLRSLVDVFTRFGMTFKICCPKGYEIKWADILPKKQLDFLQEFNDPEAAINNADFIFTDTWISMGDEDQKTKRLADFAGYQINSDMIKRGSPNPDWQFLHCLPRKEWEVSDDIFYASNSLVFEEAENRTFTALSLFYHIFKGSIYKPL